MPIGSCRHHVKQPGSASIQVYTLSKGPFRSIWLCFCFSCCSCLGSAWIWVGSGFAGLSSTAHTHTHTILWPQTILQRFVKFSMKIATSSRSSRQGIVTANAVLGASCGCCWQIHFTYYTCNCKREAAAGCRHVC